MRFRLNPKAVRVRGSYDDVYAAYGPPRSGKSNWLATVGLEAPGACLFTSTRADLAVHTAAVRARGDRPAYFINPGLDGGFPCNLYYSPVTGCENPLLAMESAGALIHAAPRDPGGSAAWIDGKSKSCLQLLLHAAALSGRDIFTVRQWAADIASPEIPLKILDARGTPGWADELASLAGEAADDPQTASGILGGITGALGWLADPVLAELARPEPGEEFDVRQFIRDQGSVYLIGADTPNNPLSPYFACFVSHFWAEAKRMAADPLEEASRDLKLDPRLLMISTSRLSRARSRWTGGQPSQPATGLSWSRGSSRMRSCGSGSATTAARSWRTCARSRWCSAVSRARSPGRRRSGAASTTRGITSRPAMARRRGSRRNGTLPAGADLQPAPGEGVREAPQYPRVHHGDAPGPGSPPVRESRPG